ncbi:hypothetical protein PROFUN_06638 [Planoprotostelium fungivorum]|uniref:MHD domain-containing protein n=1 Tax=Planoprotostelium fungivorum TaxID=1890364 RepID=A0A2P6MSW7_9EUKA|nr:hypothetical protein PROFUN_06638 [Planoprotostelium fungivorum]
MDDRMVPEITRASILMPLMQVRLLSCPHKLNRMQWPVLDVYASLLSLLESPDILKMTLEEEKTVIHTCQSVLQAGGSTGWKALSVQRYPTVESRCKRLGAPGIIPNDDASILPLLCKSYDDSIRLRDLAAENTNRIPNNAFRIEDANLGHIWPFVYICRGQMIFVAVPCIEDYTSDATTITLPHVTSTLLFLEDFSSFVLQSQFYPEFNTRQLSELQLFLSKMAPFGRPNDTHTDNISVIVRNGFAPFTPEPGEKRPAWKPFLYQGKQKIDFLIRDYVHCAQYDSQTQPDEIIVSGAIVCKGDLENIAEVTGSIVAPSRVPPGKGVVTSFSVDPCVQTSEQTVKGITSHKVCFSPPLGSFDFCRYAVKYLGEMPIRGFYQMKEVSASQVTFLIQLKLGNKMPNQFAHCDMYIPFPSRGPIVDVEAIPTAGTITVSNDKKSLHWNIGQKFTSRDKQVALPATVTFDASRAVVIDPFLVGTNAYVSLSFKMIGDNLTTIDIDTRSIVVYPNGRAQTNVMKEIVSDDYIIWNSLGDSR